MYAAQSRTHRVKENEMIIVEGKHGVMWFNTLAFLSLNRYGSDLGGRERTNALGR